MKKFVCFLFIFVSAQMSAQMSDYSKFVWDGVNQIWKLEDVVLGDDYTMLSFEVKITSKKAGAIFGQYCEDKGRNPRIIIEGDGFKYNYTGYNLDIKYVSYGGRKEWYKPGNIDKQAYVTIFFPRVLPMQDHIKFVIDAGLCGDCAPNPLDGDYECEKFIFSNIPIVGNDNDPVEKTNWSDNTLRDYWGTNKCEFIEGIYSFFNTTNKSWWGPNKHTLAVKKEGRYYKLIYLNGASKKVWQEGDVKAKFVSTGTPGVYKVTEWYNDVKAEITPDFYITFTETTMSINGGTKDISAEFMKLYPDLDASEGTRSTQDIIKSTPESKPSSKKTDAPSHTQSNQSNELVR